MWNAAVSLPKSCAASTSETQPLETQSLGAVQLRIDAFDAAHRGQGVSLTAIGTNGDRLLQFVVVRNAFHTCWNGE